MTISALYFKQIDADFCSTGFSFFHVVSGSLSYSMVCVAGRFHSFRPLGVSHVTLLAKIQYRECVSSCCRNRDMLSVASSL